MCASRSAMLARFVRCCAAALAAIFCAGPPDQPAFAYGDEFQRGDGVVVAYLFGDDSVLVRGIAPRETAVSAYGTDAIVLSVDGSGDRLVLLPDAGIAYDVRFDDGTVWTSADMAAALAGRTGPVPPIADLSRQLPSQAERQDACRLVADAAAAERVRDYLVRTGRFDVNNDGAWEDVRGVGAGGTMGGDDFEAYGADGEELEWVTVGHEWKDYFPLGAAWLLHGGRTYLVHLQAEDGYFLSHLSYVSPENLEFVLCEFTNPVAQTSRRAGGPEHNRFCSSPKEWPPPLPLTDLGEDDAGRLRVDRTSTSPVGTIEIDFDNDGRNDRLVALAFDSDAGRGCDFTYFDVLDATGSTIEPGARHDALMRLQGAGLDEVYPGPTCGGNEPSWLAVEGKAYFRNKYPGQEPRKYAQLFDDLYIVEGNEVRKICESRFTVAGAVRRIYDPYKKWSDVPP